MTMETCLIFLTIMVPQVLIVKVLLIVFVANPQTTRTDNASRRRKEASDTSDRVDWVCSDRTHPCPQGGRGVAGGGAGGVEEGGSVCILFKKPVQE